MKKEEIEKIKMHSKAVVNILDKASNFNFPISVPYHFLDGCTAAFLNIDKLLESCYKSYSYNVAIGNIKGVDLLDKYFLKLKKRYYRVAENVINDINYYYEESFNLKEE